MENENIINKYSKNIVYKKLFKKYFKRSITNYNLNILYNDFFFVHIVFTYVLEGRDVPTISSE